MKSLSTILIATLLFCLCLIEKELKTRAMDSLVTKKSLMMNPADYHNVKGSFVNLQSKELELNPSQRDMNNLVIPDSTFSIAASSLGKQF